MSVEAWDLFSLLHADVVKGFSQEPFPAVGEDLLILLSFCQSCQPQVESLGVLVCNQIQDSSSEPCPAAASLLLLFCFASEFS